jgi:hypothetical protein
LALECPAVFLCDLDAPAIGQVIGDADGAEGMAPDGGFDAGVGGTAAHHVPDIRARYRVRREFVGLADGGTEQRPLAVADDLCSLDVRLQSTNRPAFFAAGDIYVGSTST